MRVAAIRESRERTLVSDMAILRYTLLRALVFAVLAALLWLIGFRGYVLLFAALLVSGIASVFILRRSRDSVSVALDRRVSTIKDRMAERTSAEDAWNDAQREQQEQQPTVEPRRTDQS